MRFIILIISVICFATGYAQTPGYLGKRFSLGYGLYASPGYIGSKGAIPVNTQHEGFIEFAAKKRVSIGFSAKFYKTIYANKREVDVFRSNSSFDEQYDSHPSGYTDIKGRNYALYFKFFGKNYLAPWGRYFILGATLNRFTSSYDPDHMNVNVRKSTNTGDNYVLFSDFGAVKQSYTRFDVMLGWGRSRIIANRVMIDYGFNVNLIALTTTLFDAPDDNIFDETELSPDNYIVKTSAARIRSVNRFNVFCKIGILLF